VIGSVYARNPQLFKKTCMEMIEKEALKPARDVCEIVPAALGDRIGDYACLSVAMSQKYLRG
jgi:glucokinase